MCARGEAVHTTCLIEVNRWRTVGWKRENRMCEVAHGVSKRGACSWCTCKSCYDIVLVLSFSVSELTPGCTTWR